MNNTSIIVILIAVVVALGGGAYLYTQNGGFPASSVEVPTDSSAAGTVPEGTEGDWNDTPGIEINAEADASVSANTIHYTNSGFSPSSITVKKGTTLTFINQSDRDMWVASDVHPNHSAYSGTTRSEHCATGANTSFDQCVKGNIYSFTFGKVGTWDYHNHLAAQFGGTVVVTE